MEVVRRECQLCAQSARGATAAGRSSTKTASCGASEIQGHTPNMADAMNFDIATGRYFTETEYNQARPSP